MLAARREEQRHRQPNVWAGHATKNLNPAYRKSIWPEGKTVKPGRMG
jgi:hypothetical protein